LVGILVRNKFLHSHEGHSSRGAPQIFKRVQRNFWPQVLLTFLRDIDSLSSITTQSRLVTMLAEDNPARSSGSERFDESRGRDSSDDSYYEGVLSWCDAFDLDFCGGNNEIESRDDIFPTVEQNSAVLASKSFVETILSAVSRDDNEAAMMIDTIEISRSQSGKKIVPRFNPKTVQELKKYVPEIESAADTYGFHSIPIADIYLRMGDETTDIESGSTKSVKLALKLYEEAFHIYQAQVGDCDKRTINARVLIGNALLALGRHDDAIDSLCTAVYMREALLGELHLDVAEIWVKISLIHQEKQQHELALKACAKALTSYRKEYGDKHPNVLGILRNISQIHTQLGNHGKAADIDRYVLSHSKSEM